MKQSTQILVLIGLLIIAAVVWVWGSHHSPVAVGTGAVARNFAPLKVENPALHWWKLEASQKTEYKSTGRNLFSEVAPPPPNSQPSGPNGLQSQAPQGLPPGPTAPQLPANLKFYGYGTVPVGTPRLAFFTDGTDVFIVGEGDVLMGRYRILKIGNASLEFEEVGTGRRGSATIEDQGSFG